MDFADFIINNNIYEKDMEYTLGKIAKRLKKEIHMWSSPGFSQLSKAEKDIDFETNFVPYTKTHICIGDDFSELTEDALANGKYLWVDLEPNFNEIFPPLISLEISKHYVALSCNINTEWNVPHFSTLRNHFLKNKYDNEVLKTIQMVKEYSRLFDSTEMIAYKVDIEKRLRKMLCKYSIGDNINNGDLLLSENKILKPGYLLHSG
jgi:hypothetical protein